MKTKTKKDLIIHNCIFFFSYCPEVPIWPNIESPCWKFGWSTLCYIYSVLEIMGKKLHLLQTPQLKSHSPFLRTLIDADLTDFNRAESVEFFRFLSTEQSTQFSSTGKFSAVEKLLLLPESAMMKSACCRSWGPSINNVTSFPFIFWGGGAHWGPKYSSCTWVGGGYGRAKWYVLRKVAGFKIYEKCDSKL